MRSILSTLLVSAFLASIVLNGCAKQQQSPPPVPPSPVPSPLLQSKELGSCKDKTGNNILILSLLEDKGSKQISLEFNAHENSCTVLFGSEEFTKLVSLVKEAPGRTGVLQSVGNVKNIAIAGCGGTVAFIVTPADRPEKKFLLVFEKNESSRLEALIATAESALAGKEPGGK